MKKIIFSGFALIAFLAFTGCKKDNNTPAKPTCRINQISTSNGNHTGNYTITYNANGKINSISLSDASISYAYNANNTVLTTTFNDSTKATITYTLNSDGKPANLHEVFCNNNDWENVSYDYSNGELSKATYTSSYDPNSSDNSFTWQNGNLVSLIDTRNQDTTTYTYSYYSDKPYQQGDYFFYTALTGEGELGPFPFLPELVNKNLMKSFTSKYEIADATYDFDNEGKITSIDIESTLTQKTSVSYQYDCH